MKSFKGMFDRMDQLNESEEKAAGPLVQAALKAAAIKLKDGGFYPTNDKGDDKVKAFTAALKAAGFKEESSGSNKYQSTFAHGSEKVIVNARFGSKGLMALWLPM